jgi:hypothetical protein
MENDGQFIPEKDPFGSSPRTLKDLDDPKWANLAKEYFEEEDAEETAKKVIELRDLISDEEINLPRTDDLYLLKFVRAGGGQVDEALRVIQ